MEEETLTLIEKTAFLKSIPILSSIPTEPLAEVADRAREIHCDAGEALFQEGDPDRGTYLVIHGLLQLRRGRAVVRVLKTGMAFGELWLSEGEPHGYEMIAIEHSHVLNISRDDVFEAMLDYPEFGVGMVRGFALRIHELTSRVLDLERIVARLHAGLTENGIDLPDLPPAVLEPLTQGFQLFGDERSPWPELPAHGGAGTKPDSGTSS